MAAMLALALGAAAFHAPLSSMPTRSHVSMMSKVNQQDPKNFPVKNQWVTVCSTKGLKPGTLKAGFGAGQDILIAVSKSGGTFAAANVCPHIGTPLDQGTVEGNAIICPLHRSAFDLRSGKLVGPWCPAPPLIGPLSGKLKSPRELQVFKCRTQGGSVQVRGPRAPTCGAAPAGAVRARARGTSGRAQRGRASNSALSHTRCRGPIPTAP